MSRIGQKPVDVPAKVDVTIQGHTVTVKGPLGELTQTTTGPITVEYDADARQVRVARRGESRRARSLHGLYRSLINNMVEGVSKGFEKKLELYGTGYSANLRGKDLVLQVGFCHEVVFVMGKGLTCEVEQTTAQLDRPARFSIKGYDKHAVGQQAATIRAVRPPEPYKGKGIRYAGEYVLRKEGKAFATAG